MLFFSSGIRINIYKDLYKYYNKLELGTLIYTTISYFYNQSNFKDISNDIIFMYGNVYVG